MRIYTGRYANKTLNTQNYTCIRISVGAPRWKTKYEIAGVIEEIAPFGVYRKYDEYYKYKKAYFERLDSFGIERINEKLKQLKQYGKDIVLLCFEDIRNTDDWCHRRMFAEWYYKKTGYAILELQEVEEPVKKKVESEILTTNQISMELQ